MASNSVLVEAESFANFGGWVHDSQFDLEMGSPYLMAHGNRRPVQGATTAVCIPTVGRYIHGFAQRIGFQVTSRVDFPSTSMVRLSIRSLVLTIRTGLGSMEDRLN
jgi:hypothetical protein